MEYYKKLFIHNVKYLCEYDWEPEITLKLKDNKEIFIVAYKDHIEFYEVANEMVHLEKIEDIFAYFDFDDVIEIEGSIDFEFPIECQSIVVDKQLWLDGVKPKEVINKYKKQLRLFRIIFIVCYFAVFLYFIITILNSKFFDIKVIIACSVFAGSTLLTMLFFAIFDIKRNKIIKKYYGLVSEEDREKARNLLQRIHVVENNEYDLFEILRCDNEDLGFKSTLQRLIKGKKIYKRLYEAYKVIEIELKSNADSNEYNDEEYNNFIFELVELLEPNLCDI